jgi:hypothetical protein
MSHCKVCKSDDRTICNDLRIYGVSPSPFDPEDCCCSCHDNDCEEEEELKDGD